MNKDFFHTFYQLSLVNHWKSNYISEQYLPQIERFPNTSTYCPFKIQKIKSHSLISITLSISLRFFYIPYIPCIGIHSQQSACQIQFFIAKKLSQNIFEEDGSLRIKQVFDK